MQTNLTLAILPFAVWLDESVSQLVAVVFMAELF